MCTETSRLLALLYAVFFTVDSSVLTLHVYLVRLIAFNETIVVYIWCFCIYPFLSLWILGSVSVPRPNSLLRIKTHLNLQSCFLDIMCPVLLWDIGLYIYLVSPCILPLASLCQSLFTLDCSDEFSWFFLFTRIQFQLVNGDIPLLWPWGYLFHILQSFLVKAKCVFCALLSNVNIDAKSIRKKSNWEETALIWIQSLWIQSFRLSLEFASGFMILYLECCHFSASNQPQHSDVIHWQFGIVFALYWPQWFLLQFVCQHFGRNASAKTDTDNRAVSV